MKDFFKNALKIVETLSNEGYLTYFNGGFVRDLVLGVDYDDIDIVTSAPTSKIVNCFDKSYLVGESFGVVIVVLESHHFEVATFRGECGYDGRRPSVVYTTTPIEDASRRDFTINGMFYDPKSDKIIDYVGGIEDAKKGILRAIGDPKKRFKEDKLRMIRAARYATRFDFKIEEATKAAIEEFNDEIFLYISPERIWNEFEKMSNHATLLKSFRLLRELGLLESLIGDSIDVNGDELVDLPTIYRVGEFKNMELINLVEKFRLSRVDKELSIAMESYIGDKSDHEWVTTYARSLIPMGYFNKRPEKGLNKHISRLEKLWEHIERRSLGRTLISAKDLQGIQGKELGRLIHKGEILSIKGLSKEEILKLL